jgi:short-subunit dehydrogenase
VEGELENLTFVDNKSRASLPAQPRTRRTRMNPPSEPPAAPETVLVTGASTGLGLALGRKLLATDYRVILTARGSSLDRLPAAGIRESERVLLRTLDVTVPEERERVIDEINQRWGGVDVLINNAGVAYRSVVEHFTEDARLDQMLVNFRGPMDLIRRVLPTMRARRRGCLINVSSVGGMMAMPTMALYSASKFALEGATEALWYEVRPWNIRVCLIEPGFINSESFKKTRYTDASQVAADDPANPYHAHYRHMAGMIARLMERARATPDAVANTILRTMRRRDPPLRIPATWDAHLFAALRRILPRMFYHRVLYRMLPEVDEWGRS